MALNTKERVGGGGRRWRKVGDNRIDDSEFQTPLIQSTVTNTLILNVGLSGFQYLLSLIMASGSGAFVSNPTSLVSNAGEKSQADSGFSIVGWVHENRMRTRQTSPTLVDQPISLVTPPRPLWGRDEESRLINYLLSRKDEMNDCHDFTVNHFWEDVAAHMAGSSEQPLRKIESFKPKWQRVR
jgi:hypothetical protein